VLSKSYDIQLWRATGAGCGVWLNTPRRRKRPAARAGKGRHNGVLKLQRLDGWWREGYNGRTGGPLATKKKSTPNEEAQDEADSQSLYELLENDIIPLYYES